MKRLNDWTHKELMALPEREWGEESEYDSVLIVSTKKKHDSGWAAMAIIGVRNLMPVEIASSCTDDISWHTPIPSRLGNISVSDVRSDMAFKSGAIHFWSRKYKFVVGAALSSLDIKIIPKPLEEAKDEA